MYDPRRKSEPKVRVAIRQETVPNLLPVVLLVVVSLLVIVSGMSGT